MAQPRHPVDGTFQPNPDTVGSRMDRNKNGQDFTLVPPPAQNPSVSAAALEEIRQTEAGKVAAQARIAGRRPASSDPDL